MDYILDAYDALLDCCGCYGHEGEHDDGAPPAVVTRDVTVLPWATDDDGEVFGGNTVTTSKYTLLSFLPIALYDQFRRLANLYFLLISVIQLSTNLSPTNQYSTILPLIGVLTVSLIKEAAEDYGRHKSDAAINAANTCVLTHDGWTRVAWRDVAVGDLVKLVSDESVPADLVLISTSGIVGGAFIDTAQLDGESNLKARAPLAVTQECGSEVKALTKLQGHVTCEVPNPYLYRFSGLFTLIRPRARSQRSSSSSKNTVVETPVSNANVLLRGTVLRNTPWAVGLVVYAGHETKVMLNARAPPRKRSTVDHRIDRLVMAIFGVLVALCTITAVGSTLWDPGAVPFYAPYIPVAGSASSSTTIIAAVLMWVTSLLLFNNLLPISLIVTIELAKFIQARAIDRDASMAFVAKIDPDALAAISAAEGAPPPVTHITIPARARTSNLNESLGQVQYIVTDKTGTLTENRMLFKAISVGGVTYSSLESASPSAPVGPSAGNIGGAGVGIVSPRLYAPAHNNRSISMATNASCDTVSSNAPISGGGGGGTRGRANSDPMYHFDPLLNWTDPRLKNILMGDRSAPGATAAHEAMICMVLCHGVQVRVSDAPRLNRSTGVAPRSALAARSGGMTRTASMLRLTPEVDPTAIVYQSSSPDEIALVSACRALGYVLESRDDSINTLTVRVFGEAFKYELLAVNEFSSSRKRMSVLVRTPSGAVVMYVKGADSHMLNKLATPAELAAAAEAAAAAAAARSPSFGRRRTSAVPQGAGASRPTSAAKPPPFTVVADSTPAQVTPAVIDAAAPPSTPPDDASIPATPADGPTDATDVPPTLVLSPSNSAPALAEASSNGAASPSLAAGAPAASAPARAVASAVEAKADTRSPLEVLQTHLDGFASLGLRTLVLARRELTNVEAAAMLQAHSKASLVVVEREEAMEAVANEQENKLQLLAATGIEDKLQEGVADTISALSAAGIRWVMCTGDKTETAINVGLSCSLLSESTSLVVLKSSDKDINLASLAAARMSLQERNLWHPGVINPSLVLVIEGHALAELMDSDEAAKLAAAQAASKRTWKEQIGSYLRTGALAVFHFLLSLVSWLMPADAEINGATGEILGSATKNRRKKTGLRSGSAALLALRGASGGGSGSVRIDLLEFMQQCRSVICCRVSPLQKSEVVKLLQTGITPRPLVLAVGDGGNDVSMIQAADVGVGIAGVEGQQAVQAADYSIGQFRFLAPLLLVHGRNNLRRIVLAVLYCVYKNVAMVMCLWCYSVVAGWSGTSLFESYVSSMWNLLFTSLPVLVAACLDEDMSPEWALKYPIVYTPGQKESFSIMTAILWFLQALLHAALVCTVTFLGFFPMAATLPQGLIPDGCGVHFFLVVTVNIKLAMVVYSWKWQFRAALTFSLAIWFIFLAIYANLFAGLRFGAVADIYGVATALFSRPGFWLLIPLVPAVALLPDFMLLLFKRSSLSDATSVVQEWAAGLGTPLSLEQLMVASGAAPAVISSAAINAAKAVSAAAKGAIARAERSKGAKGGSHVRNVVTITEGADKGGAGKAGGALAGATRTGVSGLVIDSDALSAKLSAAAHGGSASSAAMSTAKAAEHKRILDALVALTREVRVDIQRLNFRVQRRALRALREAALPPAPDVVLDSLPAIQDEVPAESEPISESVTLRRKQLQSPSVRRGFSFSTSAMQKRSSFLTSRAETPALLVEIGTDLFHGQQDSKLLGASNPADAAAAAAVAAETAGSSGNTRRLSVVFRDIVSAVGALASPSARNGKVAPEPSGEDGEDEDGASARVVSDVSATGDDDLLAPTDNVVGPMQYQMEAAADASAAAKGRRGGSDRKRVGGEGDERGVIGRSRESGITTNSSSSSNRPSQRVMESVGRSNLSPVDDARSPQGDKGMGYGLDRFSQDAMGGVSGSGEAGGGALLADEAGLVAPDDRYSRISHVFHDEVRDRLFFKSFFVAKSKRLMRLAFALTGIFTLAYLMLTISSSTFVQVIIRALLGGGAFAFLVITCFNFFSEPAFYSMSIFCAIALAGICKTVVIDAGGFFGETLFLMGVMLVLRLRFLHALAVCIVDLSVYVIWLSVNASRVGESSSITLWLPSFVVYCLFLLTFNALSAWTLHCAMREDFISEARLYAEEKRGSELLSSMLPSYVISMLRALGPKAGNWGGLVSFAEPSVSVIFVQIADFDKVTSSYSPPDLVALLDQLWALLDALLERHGVTKLETVGKEYVACAGLHGERLDHATACISFALDVLKAASLLRDANGVLPFKLKVGINTGKLVAGIVGRTRPQFSLVGDTMNTTARIAAYGTPGRCNISPATYERIKHRFVVVSVWTEVKSKGRVCIRWVAGRVGSASSTNTLHEAGVTADPLPPTSTNTALARVAIPSASSSDSPAASPMGGGSSRLQPLLPSGAVSPPSTSPDSPPTATANIALNEAGIDASDALIKRISERGRLDRARTLERATRRSRDVALAFCTYKFKNARLEKRWLAATGATMVPGVRRCLLILALFFIFELVNCIIIYDAADVPTPIPRPTVREASVRLAYILLLMTFILFTRSDYYLRAVTTTNTSDGGGGGGSSSSKLGAATKVAGPEEGGEGGDEEEDGEEEEAVPVPATCGSRTRVWVRLYGHMVVLALGGIATTFASLSAQNVTLDFFFFFCVVSNSATVPFPLATSINVGSAILFIAVGLRTSLFDSSVTLDPNTPLAIVSIFFLVAGIAMSAFAQGAVEFYRKHRFGIAALTADEVGRNSGLLNKMLPVAIAHQLLDGGGSGGGGAARLSSFFPGVCVLFCDVAGFTKMSAEIRPDEVITMLNKMFAGFEAAASRNGVFKVQTIGDCFVCVAGMPYVDAPFKVEDEEVNVLVTRRTTGQEESSSESAGGGAPMSAMRISPRSTATPFTPIALGVWECLGEEARSVLPPEVTNAAVMLRHAAEMLDVVQRVLHPRTGKPILTRVGLHTGDVVGGVIGTKSFRYDIFGVDVLAANTMESSSTTGGILVSETTHAALCELQQGPFAIPGLEFVPRGPIECKGKPAPLETYFAKIPGLAFPESAYDPEGSGH